MTCCNIKCMFPSCYAFCQAYGNEEACKQHEQDRELKLALTSCGLIQCMAASLSIQASPRTIIASKRWSDLVLRAAKGGQTIQIAKR